MNRYLEYPQWQSPLAAAILEFDPHQLDAKLQKAEEAITNRIRELELGLCDTHEHERRLLCDGLWVLCDVRKDRLGPDL
jgi:hypothetical protein